MGTNGKVVCYVTTNAPNFVKAYRDIFQGDMSTVHTLYTQLCRG